MSSSQGSSSENNTAPLLGAPCTYRPVYDGRNKTFWFAAFEGLRGLQQSLNTNDENGQRVPTEAMWNGDFSNAFDQEGDKITIYDPLTTASDGTRRHPRKHYSG